MTSSHVFGVATAVVVMTAAVLPGASTCGAVAAMTMPGVTIVSATDVNAGPFTPPSGAPITVPAFCRVVARATPTPDSSINFEVWIPPANAWNGKFQGVGNAGWTGNIAYTNLATALRRGYATVNSDTGHAGDDLTFAIGHPEKIVDWAERAVHVTTEAGKRIVRARHGRLPEFSYFAGCSTAGAQGLTEAQRYPGDYDGILASNPGNDRTNRLASYIWSWAAAHHEPGSVLPTAKLAVLNKAAVAACDALDGVRDGVIDDPRACRFDPEPLTCRGADDGACLTAAQVEAVRRLYQGPRHPRTGEQIFPGLPRGSELFGAGGNGGWVSYVMEPKEPQRLAFFRNFVFGDPNWDWRTFDYDRDLAYARSTMAVVNATNPDLGAFAARGGKVLMTAGWNDPIHLSEQALDYYEAVARTSGGLEQTQTFFRLFMVPGLGHCAPGPGPSSFDGLAALEAWVERGIPPEVIVASRTVNGVTDRTRPLCAHPLVARWKGTGSTDDAANFSCAPPLRPQSRQ